MQCSFRKDVKEVSSAARIVLLTLSVYKFEFSYNTPNKHRACKRAMPSIRQYISFGRITIVDRKEVHCDKEAALFRKVGQLERLNRV